jgi:hypothetical protein
MASWMELRQGYSCLFWPLSVGSFAAVSFESWGLARHSAIFVRL